MKRPPFNINPSNWAQARYSFIDGRGKETNVIRSGRASYVWLHSVLVTIASGVAPTVEIRKGQDRPWHVIDYTPDEAYSLIVKHYPTLTGLRRVVDSHRRRRGLGD